MFFKGIAYFFSIIATLITTIITIIIQQRLTNALIGLFSQPLLNLVPQIVAFHHKLAVHGTTTVDRLTTNI